jgi:hypothetical protein
MLSQRWSHVRWQLLCAQLRGQWRTLMRHTCMLTQHACMLTRRTHAGPVLYGFIWFSVFGGIGLRIERQAANLGIMCAENKAEEHVFWQATPAGNVTLAAPQLEFEGAVYTRLSCRDTTDQWFDIFMNFPMTKCVFVDFSMATSVISPRARCTLCPQIWHARFSTHALRACSRSSSEGGVRQDRPAREGMRQEHYARTPACTQEEPCSAARGRNIPRAHVHACRKSRAVRHAAFLQTPAQNAAFLHTPAQNARTRAGSTGRSALGL